MSAALDPWPLLVEFTKQEAKRSPAAVKLTGSAEGRERLRQAVKAVACEPVVAAGWDPTRVPADLIVAVLSSDVRLALRALRDYCQALGVEFVQPASRVPGVAALAGLQGSPVYLKYNAASRLCYATRYQGRDRGVLLQFGQEQVGHLPLGLWDEKQERPPVPLE